MAKTYGYLYDDKYKPTECIGSFGSDTDDGFKQNLRATAESFNNSSLKAFGSDIAQIVTTGNSIRKNSLVMYLVLTMRVLSILLVMVLLWSLSLWLMVRSLSRWLRILVRKW